MHTFMTAILLAVLALVGADASTSDSIITFPTSTTASSTAIGITPNPSTGAITNSTDCSPCFCDGEAWNNLGTWKDIRSALQNSRVVRVTSIPEGYHVSNPTQEGTGAVLTTLSQVNEKIGNDHCFFFEIGVNTGNARDLTPTKITKLLNGAYTKCGRGGRWDLDFIAGDGGIIGLGWMKADPQRNSDCS